MASSSDSEDEDPHPVLEVEETRHNRSMSELPEEVLEYILSFLSPYQEHKTAALVCKQWYRLIKGVAHQCYHGFMKAVQEGNIQWESRTYPYPGTPGSQSLSSGETVPNSRPGPAQGDGHSLPPIARRLGHHPPQSLNVGKPLYQSMNCKPMQMYVLDIKDTKEKGRVKWKVFTSSSVVGPPETSLHTVVQGRGELIVFGGLMDKKQNVKYYPKTNALYFVRAKR